MAPFIVASLASSQSPLNARMLLRLGGLIVAGTVGQPLALLFLALGIYLGVSRLR